MRAAHRHPHKDPKMKITKERIKELNELGFEWNPMTKQEMFQKRMEQL